MAVPSNGLRQAQPEREWGLLGNDNRKLFQLIAGLTSGQFTPNAARLYSDQTICVGTCAVNAPTLPIASRAARRRALRDRR